MSIRNRLSRARHLDDAALAAVWSDASAAGVDPRDPHLAACPECRARFDAFLDWMEDVRRAGLAEADDAFTADRLAAQQAHIMRRLEAAERPARVITFPTFARPMSQRTSHARRWVAASAAAGLIVGVALGQFLDLRHSVAPGVLSTDLRSFEPPRSDRPAPHVQPAVATMTDDAAFMAAIDASVSRNSLSELRALDAITPRAPLFAEGQQR